MCGLNLLPLKFLHPEENLPIYFYLHNMIFEDQRIWEGTYLVLKELKIKILQHFTNPSLVKLSKL